MIIAVNVVGRLSKLKVSRQPSRQRISRLLHNTPKETNQKATGGYMTAHFKRWAEQIHSEKLLYNEIIHIEK